MNTEEKLNHFANVVETEMASRMREDKFSEKTIEHSTKTKVIIGQKYAKVDVGMSGKYMVEMETENIFGIKAYGVINKKKPYGNLDTLADWDWSGYNAVKKG